MNINMRYKFSLLFSLLCIFSLNAELLIVDSTADDSAVNPAVSALTASGEITLRSALERADANDDASNTIHFAIPQTDPNYQLLTDHWTISPQTGLPAVFAKQMTIDGYTQALGVNPATPNTNSIDQPNNAQLKIELRGPGMVTVPNPALAFDGIDFILADDSLVRGLIINNFAQYYLELGDPAGSFGAWGIGSIVTNNMHIEGCFFGVDVTGAQDLSNFVAYTDVQGTVPIFGGTVPASRNLVSGGFQGGNTQWILSQNPLIQGNTFGLDRSGDVVISYFHTRFNIISSGCKNMLVGGINSTARNVLAGAITAQILLSRTGSIATIDATIQGNYIGTDITGSHGFDENGRGVAAWGSVSNPVIKENLISGNTVGILLGLQDINFLPIMNAHIQDNIIGLNALGISKLSNHNDGILLGLSLDTRIDGNIISGNEENGIRISLARRTTITGNYIGTDATGTQLFGNDRNGIQLGTVSAVNIPSMDDVVGGSTDAERNIISGNGANGIQCILAVKDVINNNYIGASVTGDQMVRPNAADYGNGEDGIELVRSTGNTIENNLIEYNKVYGVELYAGSNQNTVQHNNIHDNGSDGVAIIDSSCNIIGGQENLSCSVSCALEKGNIIANNGGNGVSVIQKCGIAVNNAILSNNYYGNKGPDIVLSTEPCDVDLVITTTCGSCGPNHNQSAPRGLKARKRGCEIEICGTLQSVPSTDFIVQFYAASADKNCTESIFLGQKVVTTRTSGKARFVATVPYTCACNVQPGCPLSCVTGRCSAIKATATRLLDNNPTDTSMFSKRTKIGNRR